MKAVILILAALIGTAAMAASALSPNAIAADIAAHGADAVVARLNANGDYDRVLGHIDSADSHWLALAPKLAPGTDAGTAEALVIALAFALPRNPGGVLALLQGKDAFAAADVCGAPFIEDTVKDIPAYVRRARAAVSAVNDLRLATAKAQCLAALAKV
jgi:hypothetical protein